MSSRMSGPGHNRTLSDAERRQPVFGSQRFDRPAAGQTGSNPGSRTGSLYTADELIQRLLNQPAPPEGLDRNYGSRHSTVSDQIMRELALAEASFNPTDLLKEGLDEWHDRSRSMQLLRRSSSVSMSRILRNPSRTSQRFTDTLSRRLSMSMDVGKRDDISLQISQQLSHHLHAEARNGARHRYDFDFGHSDILSTTDEDGNALSVSNEYAATLNSAPHSALIHIVLLYHQALLHHGFKEEAEKIAKHLDALETADFANMDAELSGIDLLLRDGLLKYLMSVQPYIPSIPSQVIKFKDVAFTGFVQLDPGYESVLTKAKETFKGPLKKSPIEKVTLLKDLTGYLMPGTLTLVIGTLGSGISVINTVLSGRLGSKGSATTGTITYNGRNIQDVKVGRLVSVVGSNDIHFPALTVRETLEFARECSQYYKSTDFKDELREILGEALEAGQDPKLETNLSMMGLKRVAERPVGTPTMPTITEAERHRLTVAEMIAGTYAVYMFDQLNKGMDDSVTFDLITSIRIFTRVRSTTVLCSLIQPSQDAFDLFDRIIMLDRGHVVYQGPRHDVLPYFESLGYLKPRQLTVPEFLEEVTTSDGRGYLQPGFPRLSIEGFVSVYQSSDQYKDILRIVDTPEVVEDIWVQGSPPLGLSLLQSHPNKVTGMLKTTVTSINEKGGSLVDVSMNHTGAVLVGDEVVAMGGATGMLNYGKVGEKTKEGIYLGDQPTETVRMQLERPLPDEGAYEPQFALDFVQDFWPEFWLLLDRDLKNTWRNKISLIIRAVQVLILSSYVGFTFFRVHPTDPTNQLNFNLLRSVFFVSLLNMTLFNLGQLPGLVEERKIFYKQNGANFYRPSSYMLAKLVGSLPFSLAEATAWVVIVYFLSNLSTNQGGWHFWVFYIIIAMTVLNGAAMVRFLAAFMPDLAAANGMIGIMVAIFIVFAGFLIPRFQVPHWWIWAYYLDPLQWGITALMVNEFNSERYSTLCKSFSRQYLQLNFPQCLGRPDNTLGHAYLAKGQFYTGTSWIAISIGVLVGWFTVWNLLTLFALTRVRHIPRAIITPSAEAKFLRRTETMIPKDVENLGPKLSLMATPVTLSWHELSYDILIPRMAKTLPLLTYVSGWAEPGEMVGIVGATGAGKTKLLNCLAGRDLDSGRIGGQILVNGHPKNQGAFVRVMGYVDKLEAYSPYMTVREAIIFSSDVMLGKTTTAGERRLFVEEICDLLELRLVENHLVKSLAHSYLTLGESTRLRVATELARNPSVLFVDSPTKDLDGRSALHMVKLLKKIADSGRVVIVSMQVPSQRIMTCFSSILLLKRGGETVYWGPVGKDGDIIKAYFEAIPGTPRCPPNTCVTTFAIDVIGDGVQERKVVKDYAFEYRVNELALHNHIQLQRLRRGKEILGPAIEDSNFGSNLVTRAHHVFVKLQLFYWRNVAYSWGRLFSSVLTGLLLGSIYFQVKWDTTAGMNTKSGAIFITTLLQAISNANTVLPQVNVNRPNFSKEKSARQLNVSLYTFAWTFGEIPYLCISTLIYCAIFCGMSGIATQSATAFFRYWFLLFELTLAITFFGMFLASASVIPQIAGTLVTIFIGFWVATSGVVVPRKKILPHLIWVYYSNPLQWAITAMTSVVFYCDVETADCLGVTGLNKNCVANSTFCPQCQCARLTDTGALVWPTIEGARSLNYGNVKWITIGLFGYILLFRAATFVVWKIRSTTGV